MWQQHKEIIILIIGLVGGYFLNVANSLTTPTLQAWLKNWWAARSRESAQKRIAKLQSELSNLHQKEPLSVIEGDILQRLQRMEGMIIFYFGMFTLATAIAVGVVDQHRPRSIIVVAVLVLVLFIVFINGLGRDVPTRYRLPSEEASLRNSISRLEARLKKWDSKRGQGQNSRVSQD
jgi:hypothetical protein